MSLRIHLLLIDVAPSTVTGRHQTQQPVHIPIEAFVTEYEHLVQEQQEADDMNDTLPADSGDAADDDEKVLGK